MKRIIYLFAIALCLVAVSSSNCCAQIEDPFNQETLKVKEEKALPKEKPVLKDKKKEKPAEEKPVVKKQDEPKTTKVVISNPCSDKLNVEFVSLIGNAAEQEFDLTIRFTNLDVNRGIYVEDILAYDELGDENYANSQHWDAKTDVPVKGTFHFRKKVLPNKVKKLNIITCRIGGCEIEFRNVPIIWQ